MTSKTQRPPDTDYHISVRFGKTEHRTTPGQVWAYSVHIYLNEYTKRYEPKPVKWGNPTSDRLEQSAVYKNRTQWPPGASATEAPLAPGSEPAASPASAQNLVPTPPPTTNPWFDPTRLSPGPYTPKSRQPTPDDTRPSGQGGGGNTG